MRKRNNRRLYESIMRDVAKTVKKHLNENTNNNYKIWPKEKLTSDDLVSTNERDVYECQFYIDLYKALRKYGILQNYPTIKPNSLILITAQYYDQGSRSSAEFYCDEDDLNTNFDLEYDYDIQEAIFEYCNDKINFKKLIY